MPKKILPLTDVKISSSKASTKQITLNDGDGLRLIITPKKRKYFRFDYTRPNANGKRNSITIGNYPSLSLKEAREKREYFRKQVQEGIDPAEFKKELSRVKIQEENISNLFFQNISADYLQKEKMSVGETTYVNYYRYIKYMNEAFGKDKKITDISIEDISDLIIHIDINKNQQETAKRTLQCLKRVFRYAKSRGLIKYNIANDIIPADLISKKEQKHFPHVIDENELAQILIAIDNYFGDPIITLALKYQSMTFLRPANVRGLRWDIIDYDRKIITYPKKEMKGIKERKKPHIVPITKQIESLLELAAQLTKGRSVYVFASPSSNLKTLSENTLNQALHRLGFKGIMTSHGFRHTASTLLNEYAYEHHASREVIEVMLSHVEPGVKGVYNHANYLSERVRLAQWWCDYIDRLKERFLNA